MQKGGKSACVASTTSTKIEAMCIKNAIFSALVMIEFNSYLICYLFISISSPLQNGVCSVTQI